MDELVEPTPPDVEVVEVLPPPSCSYCGAVALFDVVQIPAYPTPPVDGIAVIGLELPATATCLVHLADLCAGFDRATVTRLGTVYGANASDLAVAAERRAASTRVVIDMGGLTEDEFRAQGGIA